MNQSNIRGVCHCHASINLFWLRKILVVLFVTKQYQPFCVRTGGDALMKLPCCGLLPSTEVGCTGGVQPSHKEHRSHVLCVKAELRTTSTSWSQPLRWCCVDCMIHHEWDVREEQKYMYVARTSNNRVIPSGDLYCCLLPRCKALRTCLSGFPIATILFANEATNY